MMDKSMFRLVPPGSAYVPACSGEFRRVPLLLQIVLIILLASSCVYSSCVITEIEYHCDIDDVCGCSVVVDNTDSCYNGAWRQEGEVIIITNPYTTTTLVAYSYSSGVGTLESHDYVFNLSSLPCNNGSTFQYNYVCNLLLFNNSILFDNTTLGDFQISGVCTPTTTTSTSASSSSSSSSPSSSSSSSSSPSSSSSSSSSPSSSSSLGYGNTFPNGDFGTLPGLNGSGGITIGNGTLKNMPCTGWCVIGLNKTEFTLYASIMITILVLLSIKPFRLGAVASAVSLAFFNNIVGWTLVTGSFLLLFIFIALMSWNTSEGKK